MKTSKNIVLLAGLSQAAIILILFTLIEVSFSIKVIVLACWLVNVGCMLAIEYYRDVVVSRRKRNRRKNRKNIK